MSPFPTVLALENPWVHIRSSDYCNVFANIKASVDEHLGVASTLYIPDIDPYDGHVGLR